MSDVPTRLLREALRDRMTTGASGCLDADALAAWSENRLSARERATAESHAASCARCQALVAAMIRTAPAAPPERRWSVWEFAWLAPIAAAAAAVTLWVGVPPARVGQSVASSRAPSPPPAPPAVAGDRSSDRSPNSTVADQMKAPEDRSAAAREAAAPPAPRVDERRGNAARDAARARSAQSPSADTARLDERVAIAAPPAPPAAAPASPPAVAAAPPPAVAAAPPPAVAAAPPLPAASPVPLTARAEQAPPASLPDAKAAPNAAAAQAAGPMRLAGATSDQSAARARGDAAAKMLVGATDILSPDANVRWRIVTAGSVDRSIDGGTTWVTQSTGVRAAVTAGAAPSPTICWLVGRSGIVLVSTDGRTWQRIPFPEAVDLTAIRATDGRTATVTAADGRTFTTIDAGKTWR